MEDTMICAFLFDLDGVLTDTSEFHYLGWKRLADEEGVLFERTDNEALRGVSRAGSLELILKGRTISPQQFAEWMERKNNYYLDRVKRMTPADILPGVLDLLAELKSAGIKIAVASGSKNAPLVIERIQIANWLDAVVVVDGILITRSKPAPDLFLTAAEKVGCPPKQCVVVEDAAVGIQAGKAGGMRTLGLGPVERVGEADLVLPDLAGVRLADLLSALD
jgi:beta-phosphoglucomutase